jgi:hypothetical protein
MATATNGTLTMGGVEQIGEVAGLVWHALSEGGPMSMTKLLKEVQAPRDLVLQGVGWLAREDKIEIDEQARSKTISLK